MGIEALAGRGYLAVARATCAEYPSELQPIADMVDIRVPPYNFQPESLCDALKEVILRSGFSNREGLKLESNPTKRDILALIAAFSDDHNKPLEKIVPLLTLLVEPELISVIIQDPTLAPRLDSCWRIARMSAGSMPVLS